MLLLSVFCIVLSLELGVATPPGNRFKDTRLKNVGNNEFNAERNTGEPINPNNENELISQENQKNILKPNENYETINTNNNPAAFRNVNEQPDVTSESKEYNQNAEERNFNDESSKTSYIASLPQVNRIQTFRSKDGENHEINMPRRVDILSEVNNPKNDIATNESHPPSIQENNPAYQKNIKFTRQNSQPREIINDIKEEDTRQFDVPVTTPEHIQPLFNEYKHTKKNNVKPTITNLPRNNISNNKYQSNSQNENEATFQNPSAEILYETGQAKPYEISNEPLVNSRQGHANAHSILSDKQRLKNLYLSSKPTKHYMIVYPDGRVEQVDQLDKIQKVHPNYVMLSAKELLQHGKTNAEYSTGSQRSVVKQNQPIKTTTINNIKPQLNSIKDAKNGQMDKLPQTVNDQTLPAPVEPFPDATEPPIISTIEVKKTNNVAKSSKDAAVAKIITEKNIQNQLQESGTNDSQEKSNLNDKEVSNSGTIVNNSDTSSVEVSTISTIQNQDIEDTVTTARSTISTPTADTEVLNQNITKSLPTSNNTENPNLSKETQDSNSTPEGSLINTKDDSVVTGENTTSTFKQESNKEDEISKNATTITSDQNTIKENSYTPDSIDTSHVLNDTNISNSSLVSSANREERNSTIDLNNGTVITFEDGTDSDGNKVHTETIITNYNNESRNNVSSSDDSKLVTNTNKTDITSSSIVNSENNINSLNVTSSSSLTNNTLDHQEKDENNIDTITIQNVSNVTNSKVNETGKDDNNLKPSTPAIHSDSNHTDASSNNTPGEENHVTNKQEESNLNKTISANTVKDGSKYSGDDTDDSDDLPAENPDVFNEEDGNKSTDASNGGEISSNDEESNAPGSASNVIQDDEDDDTENESETIIANDNLDTESPSSDLNLVNESSFWFNANESFWNKLMSSNNEHNSFYFLFPRPQPNTKETKKITYPNGTIVVVTTETINNGDGETTSSKTVFTCGNCTTCEKSS